MRGIAYGIAAIAAVGIMIAIGTMPSGDAVKPGDGAESVSPSQNAVSSKHPADSHSTQVMAKSGTLTLDVPDMHCEFACFPRVKETLEGSEGVKAVELAKQTEEGVIDNRQVLVTYDAGFDVQAALAALDNEGFGDSGVAQ